MSELMRFRLYVILLVVGAPYEVEIVEPIFTQRLNQFSSLISIKQHSYGDFVSQDNGRKQSGIVHSE